VSESAPTNLNVFADAPGEFQAEVVLNETVAPDQVAETEARLAGTLGFNLQPNGKVLLTLIDEEEADVHIELSGSDLKIVKELVQLCDERLTADEATRRADADWEADSA